MENTTVSWDLTDLFSGVDDNRIDGLLDGASSKADKFQEDFRGKIESDSLDGATLCDAITQYEAILVDMVKPICYASLMFAADTSKPEHGALYQHVQERQTEIAVKLLFFELELMSAKQDVMDKALEAECISEYRHFVIASRLFSKFKLSEPEEKILEETANTGCRAFDRLFEEVVSALEFKITIDGEEHVLNESAVLALLRDPDREKRKNAAASLTAGLSTQAKVLTFIFNTLVQDKAVGDRLRQYEYPEQARNLSNELSRETVEMVIDQCATNYELVARYYRTKREILGYDTLTHYDRYAPLFEAHQMRSFEEARDIVLKSFGSFSKEMEDVAGQFFTKNWIDAAPRSGKRGGAFCMYVTPDTHPYVLMNYLNKQDDIMTLGHELGHGVHAYLARIQKYVNQSTALPVAELASTFGEMLVFNNLVADSDLDDKMALYAEKIENVFATIFRQASMYKFEQALHKARREEGELTSDRIGELWQENIQAMFLDSVEMGEEHKSWWMYVNHFVASPFYVYAYSFGELLVLALYAMYRKEGEAFVPKYMEMLRTGGSCTPEELLSRIGIDIRDQEFWKGGIQEVARLISDFEKLHAEWKAGK